jgi:hypothetical protein
MKNAVVLGTDDLRIFHPCYRNLSIDQPCGIHSKGGDFKTADFYTDHDSRLWVERAVEALIERRCDILLDGTLSRPDVVSATIEHLREAEYQTKVIFIAAPGAVSLLANIARYVYLRDGIFGRICSLDGHRSPYDSVLRTAQRLDDEASVEVMLVSERTGKKLYTNRVISADVWSNMPPGTVAAIETERARVRDASEALEFINDFNSLRQILEDEDASWHEWFEEISERARLILSDTDHGKLLATVPLDP